MKKGLSAFPLTPLRAGEIDENTWLSLIENIAGAGVDSIGVLGSTGSYAYLTREQRLRVTRLALEAASDIPVITSIGSVRVEEILHLMDDAQQAGVSGDGQAASGLLAGGDVWYSVLAGLFPHYSRALANAALTGDHVKTRQLDSALQPLWAFYQRHGSLRVIATVAEMMGKVSAPCLPFPLQTLKGEERLLLQETLSSLSFLD